MNTTKEHLESFTNDQLVTVIIDTWNKLEGVDIRMNAFDIFNERLGENVSDEIYKGVWYVCKMIY